MKPIKKLGIKLEQPQEADYEAERAKYIADYTVYEKGHWSGGLFSSWVGGTDVSRPDLGEAKWNSIYPRGFISWAAHHGMTLTAFGSQNLINKVDEIIDRLNALLKD